MDHIIASQEKVFAALSDPATHDGHSVRRIDTHASAVFLAGNRVYKVKRAVRFPFLDYSTLERRKLACEAELRVNRPFAPEIYRRVMPITCEPDGGIKLGGTGVPIEWAVEMVRFNEDDTFDRLAERNLISPQLANALGLAVAASHRSTAIVDAAPWISALQSFIDQNDDAFRSMPTLFSISDIEEITALSHEALLRIRPLLLARGKLGFIRRGHGDLHLGNVVLIENHPVLFDAIEFDPMVATGDVLYDLAFLLMDLVERGLRTAANIVFNRYLCETGQNEHLDALVALPLFL